jgi:hypothetical protein
MCRFSKERRKRKPEIKSFSWTKAARDFLTAAGVVPGVRGLDAGQARAAARQHLEVVAPPWEQTLGLCRKEPCRKAPCRKAPWEIGREEIEDYVTWLQRQDYAPSSIQTSIYGYILVFALRRTSIPNDNPTTKICSKIFSMSQGMVGTGNGGVALRGVTTMFMTMKTPNP